MSARKEPLEGRPTILLLEDETELAETLADLLQESGFRVTVVTAATGALQALETEAFSLVLSDFLIGDPAFSKVQARRIVEAAGPTPVGCLTGWEIEDSLTHDYSFVLRKPFTFEDLMAKIGHVTPTQVGRECAAAIVERYFAALNNRDWSGLSRLCTEDIVYYLPGQDMLSGRVVGRESLQNHAEMAFKSFPEAKFEVEKLSLLPRAIVVHFQSTWKSASGKWPKFAGSVVLGLEAERIREIGVRMDTRRLRLLEAFEQPMGTSP